MRLGVPKETFPGEQRVAMVPGELSRLARKKVEVVVESGAGQAAGYPDAAYEEKGAQVVQTRAEVFKETQLVAQVRCLGANPDAGGRDLELLNTRHAVLGFMDPLGRPDDAARLAGTGASALAMELVPRITRAQSMDALSSMANLAGYKAVLIAAEKSTKIFPMLTTAAGTLSAAKVFVIGAGVAGLQAIATARRLGAVVEAYDVRPEVGEQVESVGGKFVDLGLSEAEAGEGGYAKEQSQDFYRRQQEAMARFIRVADVVITTAAIPGRRAPVLVTKAMMEGMRAGAVVVDLAAETGGNCEPTEPGQVVDFQGVKVVGPTNVPSTLAYHASQLYARNISTFIAHALDDEGTLQLKEDDEIISAMVVAQGGDVVHSRVKQALEAKEMSA